MSMDEIQTQHLTEAITNIGGSNHRVNGYETKANNQNIHALPANNRIRCVRNQCQTDSSCSSSDGSVYLPKRNNVGVMRSSEPYQDVLQENHKLLVTNIDLVNSTVLDQLVTDDVISVTDAESIRSPGKTKAKTRNLLLKLSSYGQQKFEKFCKCLQTEYPFLSETNVFLRRLVLHTEVIQFVYCKIVQNVDIDDIIDELYENKITGANKTKAIVKENNGNIAWNEIMHCVNSHGSGISVLCNALNTKYQYLETEIVQSEIKILACQCGSKCHNKKINDLRHDLTNESFSSRSSDSLDSLDTNENTCYSPGSDDTKGVGDSKILDCKNKTYDNNLNVRKYLNSIPDEAKENSELCLLAKRTNSLPTSLRKFSARDYSRVDSPILEEHAEDITCSVPSYSLQTDKGNMSAVGTDKHKSRDKNAFFTKAFKRRKNEDEMSDTLCTHL